MAGTYAAIRHRHSTCSPFRYRYGIALLTAWLAAASGAFAQDAAQLSPERLAEQAKSAWDSGAIAAALEIGRAHV